MMATSTPTNGSSERIAALEQALARLFDSTRAGLPGARVLDIGTGPGGGALVVYRSLASRRDRARSSLICIDRDPARVAEANRYLAERACRRTRVVHGDAHRLPFADSSVDFVTVINVIRYLELDAFAAEARRVLTPAGRMLVFNFAPQSNVAMLSLLLSRDQLGAEGGAARAEEGGPWARSA
jgi:ubiquinone/menaquinone biosynthesis C-methylase UbiE